MPFTEKVIWTVCPQGKSDAGIDINLFISPRLTFRQDQGTSPQAHHLSEVAHWCDWPKVVAGAHIRIAVITDGKTDYIEPEAITWRSKPRSDVYRLLFDETTPLNDYQFADLSGKTLLSYPAAHIADTIGALYGQLGLQHPATLPLSTDLRAVGWPRYRIDKSNEGYWPEGKDLLSTIRKQGLDAQMTSNDLHSLLNLVQLFHRPLLAETSVLQPAEAQAGRADVTYASFKPAKPLLPDTDTLKNRFDFHRRASALGNHYDLARMCGFVLELTLPDNRIPSGPFRLAADVTRTFGGLKPVLHASNALKTGTLKGTVLKSGAVDAPVAGPDQFPRTVCIRDAAGMRAESQAPKRFDGGQLVIAPDAAGSAGAVEVRLVQMDVDGAAHKATQAGQTLGTSMVTRHVDDDFADQEVSTEAAPSSLRTAGLMLAQTARHAEVKARAVTASQRNTAVEKGDAIADIFAEDLVRGYRADIADVTDAATGQWRSLNQRIVTYGLDPASGKTLPDLGTGKALNTALPGQKLSINSFARQEEGVLSLAVGSTADTSATADPDIKDVYTLHEGLFVWRGWSLSAPEPAQSLLTTPKTTAASDSDAIKHAAMVGPSQATAVAGLPLTATYKALPKSLPRLRFGHSYRARLRVVDLTGASVGLDAVATPQTMTSPAIFKRYEPVEAPAVTLVGNVTTGGDPVLHPVNAASVGALPQWGESMARAVLRTSNVDDTKLSLPANTGTARRNLAPPRVTQRFAEMHGALDDAKGALRADLYGQLCDQDYGFPEVEVAQADPPAAGQTATMTRYMISEPKFALPYLPDPLCFALHIRMKRIGDSGFDSHVKVPLYGDGAAWPNPAAVMIEGRESYPDLVYDAPSRTVRVPMPKGCRQRLRISAVLPDGAATDLMALWDQISLAAKTTGGGVTQLKLALASILAGSHWMFTPWREIEFVHAVQKPLLRPQFPAKLTTDRALGALDATLTYTTPLSGISTGRVDISATWSDPDDDPASDAAKSGPAAQKLSQMVHQRPIARLDGMVTKYAFTGVTHAFHDTRARRVTYQMDALSRFREFFPKSIRESADGVAMKVHSAPAVAWVKNSAPPPAPKVLYVIPTFGWLGASKNNLTVTKRTAGLRIYLDRPWMASGYNEMLAVILPSALGDSPDSHKDATGDDAYNRPFITQWGRDPLTISAPIESNSPPATAFTLAKWQGPIVTPGTSFDAEEGKLPDAFDVKGLIVPGQGDTASPPRLYDVAPHQVGFDPDRQLWYADIAVTVPRAAYYPFLRLAVARYQPSSVKGAHLSPAATCDFMQLSPDRVAIMVPGPTGSNQFELFLFGTTAAQPNPNLYGNAAVSTGHVELHCQLSDYPADEDLGWVDDGAFKIVAQGDSFQGAATVLAGAQTLAKLTKASPVKGQAADPAAMWTDTPPLIYWARFTVGTAIKAKKRRLLVTESEVYPQDNGTGSRIVYASRVPF